MDDTPGPVLTDPWLAPETTNQAAVLKHEATTEIAPGHELSGHILTAIASCSGCDSVAFQVDDGRFAIVHLTWTRRPEPPPWPETQTFGEYCALEAAADKHQH